MNDESLLKCIESFYPIIGLIIISYLYPELLSGSFSLHQLVNFIIHVSIWPFFLIENITYYTCIFINNLFVIFHH